jgi:hypothetical protein
MMPQHCVGEARFAGYELRAIHSRCHKEVTKNRIIRSPMTDAVELGAPLVMQLALRR